MEVEDGFAQLPDGLGERGVGTVERGMRERLARFLELVARREQILDRVIVERFGECLALSLLGGERVREQARSGLGETGDELGPPGEQHREEHAGDPDPGEEPGLRDDEAHRLGLPRGGMNACLNHVGGRRHDDRGEGDRRAQAEGDGHGDEEERQPGMREGATGEQRQHADCRDVDGGRHEREPLARGAQMDPGEHAGAPGREDRERDEEPGLLGVRMRQALAERDQRDRREPKPGNDTLRLRGRFPVRRGEGRACHHLFDQAASHRTRDRGGAIRDSELLVQVLNVRLHRRQPQVQVLRDLGQALAGGDQVQDLLFARRQRRRVMLLAQADLGDEARRRPRAGRRSLRARRRARRPRSARGGPPSR